MGAESYVNQAPFATAFLAGSADESVILGAERSRAERDFGRVRGDDARGRDAEVTVRVTPMPST
jgi:hypothetical protein